MIFKDRVEAGRLLAEQLHKYKDKNALVLGIPRGGVVVAVEVAKALGSEVDVIVTKKIGAPSNPEYALGAVDSDGHLVLNEAAVRDLGVLKEYIEKEKTKVMEKIHNYEKIFRQGKPPLQIKDRIVIVVDDGAATGATLLPAIDAVKDKQSEFIIAAVPVCPPDTAKRLAREVDEFVVLATPVYFMAIGQFYQDFEQVSDDEVKEILDAPL